MDNKLPLIKTCAIEDFSMEYLHYPSNGPDLLLLHATGFFPWLWHPIAAVLSDSYNIIVPYYCDHREGEPEDGGVLWSILAEDMDKFCASLNIKNPFAVGHSMGGAVLTLCAALHDFRPKSMVLIEPIFLPPAAYTAKITVEQHPLASKSINRRNGWDNIDEAYSYFKSKKLFSRWDNEMLDLYIKHGMSVAEDGKLKLLIHPRKEASLFMGVNAIDPWHLLPKVECPMFVVEGDFSDNKTFIDYKKVTGIFPNGSYYKVKDAGHLLPMEKPHVTSELIKEFFEGNLQK
ncbi:MAG: alpha/beta hydrolase [Spirochaetes bacterium]|nr:alpha/beta hydrolase [Spirochaetota bacterium]